MQSLPQRHYYKISNQKNTKMLPTNPMMLPLQSCSANFTPFSPIRQIQIENLTRCFAEYRVSSIEYRESIIHSLILRYPHLKFSIHKKLQGPSLAILIVKIFVCLRHIGNLQIRPIPIQLLAQTQRNIPQ